MNTLAHVSSGLLLVHLDKMKAVLSGFWLLALTCLMLPSTSTNAAEDKDSPLSLSVEAGAEYDDNITVDSSDSNSRRGDTAILLRSNIGFEAANSKSFKVKAQYNFSQSLHQDLKDFDLQIHGVSLNMSTKVKGTTIGAGYRYSFIKLGAEDFLDIHSIKPNIGFLAAKKVYMTADYEYQKQSFKQAFLFSRNSNRHSVSAKSFFLIGKGKNITLSYKVSRHTTDFPELSYWGHTADLGTKLPVKLGGTDATFRARYRYRQKDYSGVHPSIGDVRGDKRHSFRTSLEIPMFTDFRGKLQYEFVESNSNLTVVDYQSHVIGFTLRWAI